MEKNRENLPLWIMEKGEIPLIATAIHNGHYIRDELKKYMLIDEQNRLREEDPYTSEFTEVSDSKIIVNVSRFEVDFNRPKEKAVYLKPEDAWGLQVWKELLPKEIIERSLKEYELFYRELKQFLDQFVKDSKLFVVYDIHSYNHRRKGKDAPPEDPEKNPEINVGTRTMKNKEKFQPIINRFIDDMRSYNFFGRSLDVRENVKFFGGYFPKWIHEHYPNNTCVLSIEFKKIFMDEWTGEIYPEIFEELKKALKSTVLGVLEELQKLGADI